MKGIAKDWRSKWSIQSIVFIMLKGLDQTEHHIPQINIIVLSHFRRKGIIESVWLHLNHITNNDTMNQLFDIWKQRLPKIDCLIDHDKLRFICVDDLIGSPVPREPFRISKIK